MRKLDIVGTSDTIEGINALFKNHVQVNYMRVTKESVLKSAQDIN